MSEEYSQEEQERAAHAARWPELLEDLEVPQEGLEEIQKLVREMVNDGEEDSNTGTEEQTEESVS